MAESAQEQFLGMSDDAFLNMDLSTVNEPGDGEGEGEEESALAASDGDSEAEPQSGESEAVDESAAGEEETEGDADAGTEGSDESTEEGAEETGEGEGEEDAEPTGSDTDGDADEEGQEEKEPAQLSDFESLYKKVTAPFKANGKEMRVDNADDIIRLMQMGANYNRKMAALKPNLRLLKTLENNKLLDEEKISFLIDLDRGDPKAIAKLMKDRNIDFDQLDSDEEYKQTTYTADEREVELDTVIDEIKDTPTYNRTIDVVGNKWDAQSKRIVAETPQLLHVINAHMEAGIYDMISTEVERERVLGRLDGKSDIEAYKLVGDALNERGAFQQLGKAETSAASQTQTESKPPQKAAQQASARREKRRAASPTKPTAAARAETDFNPLGMSDEDFAKQFDPRLL